jgi:hypothetical protein
MAKLGLGMLGMLNGMLGLLNGMLGMLGMLNGMLGPQKAWAMRYPAF